MDAYWAGLAVLAALSPMVKRRIELSRAKHRSLAGHSRMAKRLARWMPGYSLGEDRFFDCDGAPADMAARRKAAFFELARQLQMRHESSLSITHQAREHISDLQFTAAYRVPFPFSKLVREHLKVGAFLQSAEGVQVSDLDAQCFYDLTGSYGVNVFGADFYKQTMAKGMATAQALGPVLGAYHPCVASNAQRLCELSGMDEVSFHMSGTEAVMQAVRLARYHTKRKYLVRFCGAYHGWWEDVQPGPGNPLPPRETYTLSDMSERSLEVLRSRKDISCVLVNPLQALHPNKNAPGDSTLVDSSRSAGYDREAYTAWLRRLREVCTEGGIALIFDEVFLGFRLARGGAQSYFGVQADLVTYGKTLGGGFPVGVVCGKREWMRRWREERPADICFARGTFNAHPVVMGAMSAFLDELDTPAVQAIYEGLDERWNGRTRQFNDTMLTNGLPVRANNMSSVWTLSYTRPSRYNWMLQYYLRLHGLALSWVGTGRLIFSLNYGDQDFEAVLQRFVQAASQMRNDGWWWESPTLDNRNIRRRILRETFGMEH
jgi:glutamate-1-semialdehyde 2,1-aminomutase